MRFLQKTGLVFAMLQCVNTVAAQPSLESAQTDPAPPTGHEVRSNSVPVLTPTASVSPTRPSESAVKVDPPKPLIHSEPVAHEQTMRAKLIVEFGLLDPLSHRIQFDRDGTEFNYVKAGGQDVLFPTTRLSVEGFWNRRHGLIFLYQPIDLRTEETLRKDLVVDNLRFPAGTPMNLRYGFDFYRVSYLYNFFSSREDDELSLGGSVQLRNAIIDFTSADGLLRRTNRDVGPVPAIKSRGRWHVGERAWLGYEADGMYAPVKYINGGKSDVVGAILDFSLRVGYDVAPPLGVFFNARYLGGGATGTSKSDAARGPGDGYTSNWLHFLTSTVGVEVKLERLFNR